ncbi:DUF6880 family protein [Salinisphaera orenii]|uniref:DUF6880 family protein n=1 Tax=Salinisphaera orenii TaxID=856731 RepID=UPI000DBE3EB1
MASRKTLNASNLESLGAPRLAELLLEISTNDAAAKRQLRLALADATGAPEVAKEVRKRLAAIGKARSFVDWRKKQTLVQDLDTQLDAIVDKVAPAAPDTALDLIWRFLGLAASLHERCDDSNGALGDVFYFARQRLGPIAEAAGAAPERLADQAYAALTANDYGQYDGLIAILKPALGATGLSRLKEQMIELSHTPVQRPPDAEREIVGYGMDGPTYADEIAESSRRMTVQLALQDIADAEGDVDAYIAQYDEATRRVPKIAADIAQRLMAADRPTEALATLEAAEQDDGRRRWPVADWEDARIAALDAVDRREDAQTARWSMFERTLSAPHLKAYLKRLDDDLDAEEQALDYALRYPDSLQALHFLRRWPDLDRAARLVIDRADELDGDCYWALTPAAQDLADRSPLAATLLLRAMIDFTLAEARSSRYKHAARHLDECRRLASSIDDFGDFEAHADYDERIRHEHHRKTKFQRLIQSR